MDSRLVTRQFEAELRYKARATILQRAVTLRGPARGSRAADRGDTDRASTSSASDRPDDDATGWRRCRPASAAARRPRTAHRLAATSRDPAAEAFRRRTRGRSYRAARRAGD